ncbi:MAG: hypothetical protein Q8P82_03330 [bacterium]|nr:hypothetical protein [bacterium]
MPNRFGSFAGRAREKARLLALLKSDGILDRMPLGVCDFIDDHYDTGVPYHGPTHVLSGLLYLGSREAPIGAQVVWIGHDAGHNGFAAESPEIVSAMHAFEWLHERPDWLAANSINPQDCVEPINDTRFPYAWPRRSAVSGWVRLADTLRIASGDTASLLDGDGTPFHAYFYESIRFCDELHATKKLDIWNARGDLLTWLGKGQIGFFFPAMEAAIAEGDRFTGITVLMIQSLFQNHERLKKLLSSEAGAKKLLHAYDFLGDDITFPEFVVEARAIGL